MEEGVRIGEEGARFHEYLGVRRPAQPFVALRAVRGDGKVVGTLAPEGVGDEFVDAFIPGPEGAGLQLRGDGSDRNGEDLTDLYRGRCGNGHIAVAEEGAEGFVDLPVLAGKSVFQEDAIFRNAQVLAMHAAFRTVHAAAAGAVSVVQDFSGEAGEDGALFRLEDEIRHGGGVLAEVHHQGFPFVDFHGAAVFPQFHHLAESFLLHRALHVLPDIGFHGAQGQVFPVADLRAVGGQDFTLELRIDFRDGEFLRRVVAGRDAGVVFLAVEDAGVGHGTGDAGHPVRKVGAFQDLTAIRQGEFQHAAEGAFISHHAFAAAQGDDFVGPPAGGHLRRKDVGCAGGPVIGLCDVIGVGAAGFQHVGVAGLQGVGAHGFPVQVQLIDAQTGGHPFGRCHLPGVLYC